MARKTKIRLGRSAAFALALGCMLCKPLPSAESRADEGFEGRLQRASQEQAQRNLKDEVRQAQLAAQRAERRAADRETGWRDRRADEAAFRGRMADRVREEAALRDSLQAGLHRDELVLDRMRREAEASVRRAETESRRAFHDRGTEFGREMKEETARRLAAAGAETRKGEAQPKALDSDSLVRDAPASQRVPEPIQLVKEAKPAEGQGAGRRARPDPRTRPVMSPRKDSYPIIQGRVVLSVADPKADEKPVIPRLPKQTPLTGERGMLGPNGIIDLSSKPRDSRGANGCSFSPDRFLGVSTKEACDKHDICYGKGSGISREECDARFLQDHQEAGLAPGLARAYYDAVRTFGLFFYEGDK